MTTSRIAVEVGRLERPLAHRRRPSSGRAPATPSTPRRCTARPAAARPVDLAGGDRSGPHDEHRDAAKVQVDGVVERPHGRIRHNVDESARDLVDWCRVFEDAHPLEILRWAGEEFGDGLVVTASFGDAVLVHLVSQAIPDADVVLLDTGYLFAETAWYAEHLREAYGLNLRIVGPRAGRRRGPLADRHRRLLRGAQGRADAAGARRQDGVGQRPAPGRLADPGDDADRPRDLLRDVMKINPIATWTDEDVEHYKAMELLPEHPLTSSAATRRSAAGRAPARSPRARTPAPAAGPAAARPSAASTSRRPPRRSRRSA